MNKIIRHQMSIDNRVYCKCGVSCMFKTSKTARTLGKRYGCCRNGTCKLFFWMKERKKEQKKKPVMTIETKWLNLDKEIRNNVK